MCGFAMYDIPNVDVVGYDVVSNRPKVAAYRAPGAPITSFAVESAMDELARKLGIDPLTLREKNAAKNGTKTHYGPTHQNIGFIAALEAAKTHPHWKSPLKPGQGRGLACRLLVQHRRRILGDGAYQRRRLGDGGDRQPGYRRLARLDRHDGRRGAGRAGRKVRTIVADTASIGFTFLTGGSRVTFATGMAATQAAEKVVKT